MKNYFRKYLYVAKYEKAKESAIFRRIAISIALIVVSLAAMSFSAFAYFSHTASSGVITIKSANYDLDISVDGLIETDGKFIIANDTNADKNYTFTISVNQASTATVGYCKIAVVTDIPTENTLKLDGASTLDNVQYFYTEPIWTDSKGDETKPSLRTVTLTVPKGREAQIVFIAEWGSCTKNSVKDGVIEAVFEKSTDTNTDNIGTTEPENTQPAKTNTTITQDDKKDSKDDTATDNNDLQINHNEQSNEAV